MTRDEIEALCDEIDRLEIPFGLARPVMLATSALRALAQENEALRADKERLDWLERAALVPVYVDCNPPGVPCYLTWEGHERTVSGDSLRAALDAARAGETTL